MERIIGFSKPDGITRKNGLEAPFHPFQVSTWLLLIFIVIHYFAFLMPLLWNEVAVKVLMTFTFCAVTGGVLLAAYKTCSIDPTDDFDLKCMGEKGIDIAYCYWCERNVRATTKHCTCCRKCVSDFDHHCIWLNTCIGSKNYRYFFLSIMSVSVLTALVFGISLAYVIESFASPDTMRERIYTANRTSQNTPAHDVVEMLPLTGVKIISITGTVVYFMLLANLYQLLLFHVTIAWQGTTTFQFIVEQQQKARDRYLTKAKEALASSASSADAEVSKAIEAGTMISNHGFATGTMINNSGGLSTTAVVAEMMKDDTSSDAGAEPLPMTGNTYL